MKILCVGDLVGENGLQKLRSDLKNIQEAENIDFTIVNAENVAGGMGITTKIYNELCKMNIDVLTMGNHTWGKKDIFTILKNDNIVRPANYSRGVPGHGYTIKQKNGMKICVINLIGRTDMGVLSDNPLFFLINSYTTGLSSTVLSNILELTINRKYTGSITCGEVGLPITSCGLVLPCGIYGRWESNE